MKKLLFILAGCAILSACTSKKEIASGFQIFDQPASNFKFHDNLSFVGSKNVANAEFKTHKRGIVPIGPLVKWNSNFEQTFSSSAYLDTLAEITETFIQKPLVRAHVLFKQFEFDISGGPTSVLIHDEGRWFFKTSKTKTVAYPQSAPLELTVTTKKKTKTYSFPSKMETSRKLDMEWKDFGKHYYHKQRRYLAYAYTKLLKQWEKELDQF